MNPICEKLSRHVIRPGICVNCGLCVALDASGKSRMEATPFGPLPRFDPAANLPEIAWEACPGKGIDYPELYRLHYGALPSNYLVGQFLKVRTGHSADPLIRRSGASGGVTTHVLIHLLETGRIDAALLVKQGATVAEEAEVVFARSRQEILEAAQSVYTPVASLAILPRLIPGERYAMTALPEQSAALRWLQHRDNPAAQQIRYLLGPYTGTALYPAAIRTLLRSKKIADRDAITSLRWRAGEWPGYLEIKMASGAVVRSKKVYYNFLIPFFVTQTSLQSMDFANEFCDLSVGDAWSPKFESLGEGFSVVVTRSAEMEAILSEMRELGHLQLTEESPEKASEMHGHMIDFKKRGGWLRNQWRRKTGRRAPDYGWRPPAIPFSRLLVEVVISGLFTVAGTGVARKTLELIPESIIGPLFNWLRLTWKALSKPSKRKGLGNLLLEAYRPAWKEPEPNFKP